MKNLSDTFTLSNGVKIPCVGFGTWRTPDGEVAVSSVKEALKVGYRHIDTAAAYKNEGSIGKAIKESGVPREEIFVTSKLANPDHGYETTLSAFDKTMEELDLEYLDLYLIHWPVPVGHREDWKEDILATWRAFEELYKKGRIKAIGVSNFKIHHLQHIIDNCEIKPMVNQIEFHPSCLREDIVNFCRENNILVEAWSPLASGEVFKVEELKPIAERYNKNVAQLVIRWVLQKEVLPLPKSVHSDRIKANGEIFDFEISDEDMHIIDKITSCKGSGSDPDFINF